MVTTQPPISEPLRKTILIVATITVSVLSALTIIIAPFIISNIQTRKLEGKMFQKYEKFSQKIIPSNFTLMKTNEYPGSFDSFSQVEQIFHVHSTYKEIIDQLEPIFQKYGFRTYSREDNRWILNNSKTNIGIHFSPEDTLSNHDLFPMKVEAITIWWSCTVGVHLQICADGKDLSI